MKAPTSALLALAFLAALPPGARAFLGDDLPTIEAHYGAALNRYQLTPGLEASVHESTGYRVLVLYRDGHSHRETFAKLAAPFDFTAPEINTFLRGHAAGLRWDFLGSANGASLWTRPYALATYLSDGEKTTLSFEGIGDDPTAGVATGAGRCLGFHPGHYGPTRRRQSAHPRRAGPRPTRTRQATNRHVEPRPAPDGQAANRQIADRHPANWQPQRTRPARPKLMKHWLVKQEPDAYPWSRFVADGRVDWTGVRNFQARNFLRQMAAR